MVKDATLVTRPNRDSPDNGGMEGPLAYGVVWLRSVLNSLAWRGGTRKQLYGDEAVRSKFEEGIQSLDPSFFVGMGHGNADTFTGQYIGDYSVLLTTANADRMAGRVVYLLSCLTAQQLGPALIQRGAVAYAGYNEPFTWVVADPSSPATDRLAAPFGRVSAMFPKVLAGGKIVGVAKEEALKTFDQEIERWENSTDPYGREVVKWLLWDRDAFTVLGNEEARGLDPKIAVGLVISAVGVGALGYGIYRYRRRRKR